ncbi:MAG: ABC transporter permease [Bdellovibrionaceae bacterium]|nr:ABC transporter permease [Pseudobdellovibrionaceae bacterium]
MLFLSWRQLMARKKQTLLILMGISIGTLLFVGISGVQLGMRAYLAEQLLNNTAHVLISGDEKLIDNKEITDIFYGETKNAVYWIVPPMGRREETRLENYGGWYERLSNDLNVIDFAPRLNTNALLTSGKFKASVNLIGTIPEKHIRITSIEKYMKQGHFANLAKGGNQIVIGSGVAEKLGVRLDQFVNVSTGDKNRPFKVVGVVKLGNEQIDDSIAYAHLNDVQTITRSPGRVTEIAVALTDIDMANEVADQWQLTSRDKVEDWQEANRMFMEVIKVQDFVRYFITFAILIVAAFGIYNVLSIMINQKKKEIAILRAIGYGPKRILELIFYQGLILGLSGGVMGLLFGYLICIWIESIDLGIELGGSNHLFVSYTPSIYVTAFFTANVSALIATLFPAWGASRMTPMEIIRED